MRAKATAYDSDAIKIGIGVHIHSDPTKWPTILKEREGEGELILMGNTIAIMVIIALFLRQVLL